MLGHDLMLLKCQTNRPLQIIRQHIEKNCSSKVICSKKLKIERKYNSLSQKEKLAGKQLQGLVILKMNVTFSKIFYLETICKYASQEKIRIQHNNIFIILTV